MRSHVVIVIILVLVMVQGNTLQVKSVAGDVSSTEAALTFMVNPPAVVVKVGESVNVTITITSAGNAGRVCFSLEGYPGGLQISFTPECTATQVGNASILTIEVTPAAAPQSFTALVVARAGTQTVQTPLDVKIEPAMAAWIPWLGLILFFLFLGVAVFWNPKLPFRKASRSKQETSRQHRKKSR